MRLAITPANNDSNHKRKMTSLTLNDQMSGNENVKTVMK